MKIYKKIFIILFLFLICNIFSIDFKPIYTFKVVIKKRFSKKYGTLKVYPYKFIFKSEEGKDLREWNFREIEFVEWNGSNILKIHFKGREKKFLFRKKKIKLVIISPDLTEDIVNNINNLIFKVKKAGIKLNFKEVEEKLPLIFKAKHVHLIGECYGRLIITRKGIEYKSSDGEHVFNFFYEDIKEVSRDNPGELEVVIFKKSAKKMWKSEKFIFKLLKGRIISDDVFLYMKERVRREE